MHAQMEIMTNDPFVADEGPIVTPLVREQLEDLLGGVRNSGIGGPERALMQAMLLCLMGQAAPMNERPALAAEARAWVESRSRAWIFSFESVCDALGINADYARRRLTAIADRPSGEEAANGRCALRSLRKGGGRRRKAIHFMVTRRRRAAVED